jgi:hypothetical protein
LKQYLDQILSQLPVEPGAPGEEAPDVAPLIAMGEEILGQGDGERAATIFAQIIEIAPDNTHAHAGLIRALLAAGHKDEAQAVLDGSTPSWRRTRRWPRPAPRWRWPSPEEGGRAFAPQPAAPDDMEAQLAFANGLFAAGDRDAAADKLLAMVAADRTWNEGAARARLQIFEAIGLEDPWVAPAASCRPCCSADAHERGGRQDQAFDLPAVRGAAVPGLQLPLHIFEPRYRAMVSDALARDRRIAMIQPQAPAEGRCSRWVVWARSRMSRRWKTGVSTSCWRAWRAFACCANWT